MPARLELANAIRALSMDAVQKANSGHPGMPMGMADIAEVLWNDFLRHNPANPSWANRDRFVLSNGHGSMLLYSLLHLSGYDLPKRLYIRWQSIVERKTYKAWVDLPEEARTLLRLSNTTLCPATPEDDEPVGMAINMGLAPGGVIIVWVRDPCFKPIQVARLQAEIEPLGPHQGESEGHYYPQKKASKRYIERFVIPYDSW